MMVNTITGYTIDVKDSMNWFRKEEKKFNSSCFLFVKQNSKFVDWTEKLYTYCQYLGNAFCDTRISCKSQQRDTCFKTYRCLPHFSIASRYPLPHFQIWVQLSLRAKPRKIPPPCGVTFMVYNATFDTINWTHNKAFYRFLIPLLLYITQHIYIYISYWVWI